MAFCVYLLHKLLNVEGGWWAVVFSRFLSQLDIDKHGASIVHTALIFIRMRWQALPLIHILHILFCVLSLCVYPCIVVVKYRGISRNFSKGGVQICSHVKSIKSGVCTRTLNSVNKWPPWSRSDPPLGTPLVQYYYTL